MTRDQFENLKTGDLVTACTGKNKGLIMKVVRTFIHSNTGKPMIVVEGVNEEDYIHSRSLFYKDGHHTCGTLSYFKIIQEKEPRKYDCSFYLSETELSHLNEICDRKGVNKARLLRELIEKEYINMDVYNQGREKI